MSKYLRARIIEGADVWYCRSFEKDGYKFFKTDNDVVCIDAPCDQKGFNALYKIGKMLWDSDRCSKFEIVAFDSGKLFWVYRPDMYNFERNRYANCFDKSIGDIHKLFVSDKFQNDKVQMDYLRDYKNRFWRNKTVIYSVGHFEKTIKDTQLKEDLDQLHQYFDKTDEAPEGVGFVHNGTRITNPLYDETLRFQVEPLSYYGVDNVTNYIEQFVKKLEIKGLEQDSLAEKISSARAQTNSRGENGPESLCKDKER